LWHLRGRIADAKSWTTKAHQQDQNLHTLSPITLEFTDEHFDQTRLRSGVDAGTRI